METLTSCKTWLDCHHEAAARRVLVRLWKHIESPPAVEVEPYFKGGFQAMWGYAQVEATWEAAVLAALRRGHRVATPWSVQGDFDEHVSATASRTGHAHISIAGITMLTWDLRSTE
jgi:hypothetical protein